MGAKSTNVTTKQMLPLFQVISDLEKPGGSNTSILTNNSNYYFENLSVLGSEDIIVHHYSNSEEIIPRQFRGLPDDSGNTCYSNSEEIIPRQFHGLPEGSGNIVVQKKRLDGGGSKKNLTKRRSKKRRRLKMSERDVADYHFKGKKVSEKKKSHRHKECDSHQKSHKSKEDHLTDTSNNHSVKSDQKRTGLFTEMALSMYKDEGIDISRHFKNLSKEDFNSETDNITIFDHSDCPTYEVPKDIIGRNGRKSRRKGKTKNAAIVVEKYEDSASGRVAQITRSKSKMSTKGIVRNYEDMLAKLLAKCQERDLQIQEKDGHILKMKNKIKDLFVCNNQFADENEFLKHQHEDMKVCIEQYKNYAASMEDHTRRPELDCPGRRVICDNCSSNEITAIKVGRLNSQLSEDLVMLKNVVYRLNVQLLRYQDKLRTAKLSTFVNCNDNNREDKHTHSPTKNIASQINEEFREFTNVLSADLEGKCFEGISIPSLPVFDKPNICPEEKQDYESHPDQHQRVSAPERRLSYAEQIQRTYSIEKDNPSAWGDVNTHTLGPLLNAYQESIVEKDQLIRDYEAEFNRFTTKLKQVVEENDAIHLSSSKLAAEVAEHRSRSGMAIAERDALRRESEELKEKVLLLGGKLKEVHELYEQKVETLSRDYNLIHEEYFRCKTTLAATQSRCQVFEDQRKGLQSTIPANVYNNTVQECKRLFEELKNRYEADKSRQSARIAVLQQNNDNLERKFVELSCEKHKVETKAKNGDKVVRKCRKEVAILRGELAATRAARDSAKRRSGQAANLYRQIAVELQKGTTGDHDMQQVKAEKILVQKEAMKELDAVENIMKEQDKNLDFLKKRSSAEIARLEDMLRESNATVEAMRQHINKERLEKYGTSSGTAHKIPEEVSKMRVAMRNEDITRKKPPPTHIIPAKGGFLIQKDRSKPATSGK